jgi:hypothetical protein
MIDETLPRFLRLERASIESETDDDMLRPKQLVQSASHIRNPTTVFCGIVAFSCHMTVVRPENGLSISAFVFEHRRDVFGHRNIACRRTGLR